ncbi:hypothetical protein ES707_09897 [subsurface metagenome]
MGKLLIFLMLPCTGSVARVFLGRLVCIAQLEVEPSGGILRSKTSAQDVESIVSSWQNPEAVNWVHKMMDKYGMPDEATAKRLIWHNNGPWKRTMIVDEAIPHNFPVPHQDFLYQVASYRVNRDKACDVLNFDESVILDVTKGEVGSRCHMEEANFITTNMAVEIMEGKRNTEEARQFMAMSMMEKKNMEYMNSLRFTPMSEDQARTEGTKAQM